MEYAYEALFTYSDDDECWYVEFDDFGGGAYTDGKTIEEAARNAADVLKLTICGYLDDGKQLPAPIFHNPPLTIVCVSVDERDIELSKCITVSEAAELLGVTPGRVSQLLTNGQLESYVYGTTRLVTIASVNNRIENKPAAHRPRKAATS